MATLEVNASSSVCRMCGTGYSRLKGYFPVCYSPLYKGVGYMPYCKKCVDDMYNNYLDECGGDAHEAVRQMCRKLDLYWNESIYKTVATLNTTKTMMTQYIGKANSVRTAGRCYDDTLREEKALWVWPMKYANAELYKSQEDLAQPEETADAEEEIEIPDSVRSFWGAGNTSRMYLDLQERYEYWIKHLPAGVDPEDIGVQALLRQICSLELQINRENAAGRNTDKLANTLNNYLGSAMLKPAQKNADVDANAEKTPFGVWLYKWENERPLPEIDDDLKDVNGITKYILVWVYGHLCKMLGIKNSYSKLYQEEMDRLRVEKPEYTDDDDDTILYDVFSGYSNVNDGINDKEGGDDG